MDLREAAKSLFFKGRAIKRGGGFKPKRTAIENFLSTDKVPLFINLGRRRDFFAASLIN